MSKILVGGIVQNPTDLQHGSVNDQIVDRAMLLTSAAPATWSGTTLTFSQPLELNYPLEAGAAMAQDLIPVGTSPISLSTNQVLIVNLSRAAGPTILTVGTYPTLSPGQYAVVNISSLVAFSQLTKDHVIVFRVETEDGNNYLQIPINKQSLVPGGSFPIVIPDPSIYTATFFDPISTTLPTGSSVTIDGVAGANGNTVLYTNLASGNNELYLLGGVGTSITWTPQAIFMGSVTPSNAMLVKFLEGIGFQDQIAIFNGTNWLVNKTIRLFNGADYIQLDAISTVDLVSNSTGTVFSLLALGNENMIVQYSLTRGTTKEAGQIYLINDGSSASASVGNSDIGTTGVIFSASLSTGNVNLLYTADNSGPNPVMKFSLIRWSDAPGGSAGVPNYNATAAIPLGYLDSSFVMSDGSGIAVNCSQPFNVAGKTRITLDYSYTPGVDPGTTAGDIDVIADGLELPRFIAGATLDAYYKEIDSTTIEFYTDLTPTSISLETRRKQGTVDVSSSATIQIAALRSAVVGNLSDVLAGRADYSSISAAVSGVSPGGKIILLPEIFVENIIVPNTLTIEGYGFSSQIQGTLTFSAACDYSLIKNVYVTGNITFQAGSTGNIIIDSWQTTASTVTDSGSGNVYLLVDV